LIVKDLGWWRRRESFPDYSGKKPEIVDPTTGAVRLVELFVAVLGASNYTYAEATETQRSADFIASHGRALEFLAGVPAAIVNAASPIRLRQASRAVPAGGRGRIRAFHQPSARKRRLCLLKCQKKN
jgi:hypothetical protein